MSDKKDIDKENAKFWNEMCGTHLARKLGIEDDSPESLEKFDKWYFDFYPYLFDYIPFSEMKGKKVLEVGLGYGTVSQKIGEAGAIYSGLDIAAGPVLMVNHRFEQAKLNGKTQQGSVLEAPFPDNYFDFVVAIGCYHHTGNLQKALDETWRVLKPGGKATVMVYNAYSYRRWLAWPLETYRYWLNSRGKLSGNLHLSSSGRAAYDTNTRGEAAPETVYESILSLRKMTDKFKTYNAIQENIGAEGPLRIFSRKMLLNSFGHKCGLDIYFKLEK